MVFDDREQRYMTRPAFFSARVVALGIAMVLLAWVMPCQAAPARLPNVLIINSYHNGFSWSDAMIRGLRSTLREGEECTVFVENLNALRLDPVPEGENVLFRYLRYKYTGDGIDVLVAIGNEALQFVRQYRNEVAPGAPIVFCGVNADGKTPLPVLENSTGVEENVDIRGTLDVARGLQPGLRRVLLLSDDSSAGIALSTLAHETIRGMDGIEVAELRDATIDSAIQRVAALGPGDAVLLLTCFRDSKGRIFCPEEVVSRLSAHSKAPVYALWGPLVGNGAVGGHVVDGFSAGKAAGARLNAILAGRPAGDIPVCRDLSRQYLFDFNELQRFGFSRDDLPAQSLIKNEPTSIRGRFPILRTLALLALVLLLVLLGSVVYSRRSRQRMRQALSQSEHRHLRVINTMLDGFYRCDMEGNLIEVNPATAAMYGFAGPEDMLGVNIARELYFYPEQRAAFVERIKRTGAVSGFEVTMKRVDGTLFEVEANSILVHDATGKPIGVEGVIRDITARKQAEYELSENARFLDSVLENIPNMIFVKDADELRFVRFNRAGEELLGLSRDQLLGKNDYDFFPDDQAGFFVAKDRETMTRGVLLDIPEEHIHTRVKGDRILHTKKIPIVDSAGAPRFLLGISEDITEKKLAEEELQRLARHLEEQVQERTAELSARSMELEVAISRLRELDEHKNWFLSTVSHEIRTPLTSVLGFAKMIRKDFGKFCEQWRIGETSLGKAGKRILLNSGIIESEGKRLTRLINTLLDLSKIEAGSMEWRDSLVDVHHLVEQAVNSVSILFSDKPAVTLAMDLPDIMPRLYVDPDRMVQVLVNLLGNAIKFTEQGSVEVAVRVAKNALEVCVRDSGPGIPSHELEHVFSKFRRCQNPGATSAPKEGTGLGLAITKQIVEHYGGRIWVESTLGEGSRFLFRVPLDGRDNMGRGRPEAVHVTAPSLMALSN